MRASEIRWLFGRGGGISRLLPKAWASLEEHWLAQRTQLAGSAAAEAAAPAPQDQLLHWYAYALAGAGGDDGAMGGASAAWSRFEMGCFGLSSRLRAQALPPSMG